MKIHWQEFELDAVLRHFANGFTERTGEKIIRSEWFIDQPQGKVIFRIYTEDEVKRPTKTTP